MIRIIVACLFMAACSSDSADLRVWTPEDHAHPPDTQIDPNRVRQKDSPNFTVGELLWQRNCARCHGTDGQGGREAKVNLSTAEWQDGISDATIARTIAAGKPPSMPAFAELLAPEQITELVDHVRTFGAPSE
ncbi:MAG: c-type cytochrome [Myxococcales bacterium]|nr:c-type cytochrome [Myxococcales bacterium]